KGIYIGQIDGWDTYYDVDRTEANIQDFQDGLFGDVTAIRGKAEPVATKWATHFYPLAELKMGREQIRTDLERMGITYLLSSECDHCPHKDLERWERTSPDVIDNIAKIENLFYPYFFFTDERIPLKEAIDRKRSKYKELPLLDNMADKGN